MLGSTDHSAAGTHGDHRIFAAFFESTQQYWGRHGFDSGYVVRVSMQSGGERLLKTISKP